MRQLVKSAWVALKPVVFPAAWLFLAHTVFIMFVDRFTHRLVNEGAALASLEASARTVELHRITPVLLNHRVRVNHDERTANR